MANKYPKPYVARQDATSVSKPKPVDMSLYAPEQLYWEQGTEPWTTSGAEQERNLRTNEIIGDLAYRAIAPGAMIADYAGLPEDSYLRMGLELPGPGELVKGPLALGYLYDFGKTWDKIKDAKMLSRIDQEIINQDYKDLLAAEKAEGVAPGKTYTAQRNIWENYTPDNQLGMWEAEKAFGSKTQREIDDAQWLYGQHEKLFTDISYLLNRVRKGLQLPSRQEVEHMLGPGNAHIAYGPDAEAKLANVQFLLEREGLPKYLASKPGSGAGGAHAGLGLNTAIDKRKSAAFHEGFSEEGSTPAHYSLSYAIEPANVVSSQDLFSAPQVWQLKENQPKVYKEMLAAGATDDMSIEAATKLFLKANPDMRLSDVGKYLHSGGLEAIRTAPGGVVVFTDPGAGGVFVEGRSHGKMGYGKDDVNPYSKADSTLDMIYGAGGAMFRK